MIAAVRATSLASRFLATLLITCILPLLVFGWFTLGSVRSLIDAQVVSTFVPRLCADHAQKIEDKLRQIYQSCAVVREIARRALDQRGKDTGDKEHRAAAKVADHIQGRHRWFACLADGVQNAGHADIVDVVTRHLAPRAGLPPTGHPAIDQLGIDGMAGIGADAHPLGHAGPDGHQDRP